MKTKIQHDLILSLILQEIRELKKQNVEIQKDLDLLTVFHKTTVGIPDYMLDEEPFDLTQFSWYRDLMDIKSDLDSDEKLVGIGESICVNKNLSTSTALSESLEQLQEPTQGYKENISDEKAEKSVFIEKSIGISKLIKNIDVFIKNLRR